MESFNDKFLSILDFLKLTTITISNNFYNLVALWAVSSIFNFILDLLFTESSIQKLYFTVLIFTYVNIVTALMVNCDCEDEEFNFVDAMQIVKKHNLGFFLLNLIVSIIIVLTIFIVVFSIGNAIGWIVLLISYPIIIVYMILRYKFCLQLTAFYNIGSFEALSRSYQITRRFILKLFFLYLCVFIIILVLTFVTVLFPALIKSLLIQILNIFFSIFDAYVALNILCIEDDTDSSYSDFYSDNYSNDVYKNSQQNYDTYEIEKPNTLNSMDIAYDIADDATDDNYWDI